MPVDSIAIGAACGNGTLSFPPRICGRREDEVPRPPRQSNLVERRVRLRVACLRRVPLFPWLIEALRAHRSKRQLRRNNVLRDEHGKPLIPKRERNIMVRLSGNQTHRLRVR